MTETLALTDSARRWDDLLARAGRAVARSIEAMAKTEAVSGRRDPFFSGAEQDGDITVRCLSCSARVDLGFHTNEQALLRLDFYRVKRSCQHCGQSHTYPMSEAFFVKPIPNPPKRAKLRIVYSRDSRQAPLTTETR